VGYLEPHKISNSNEGETRPPTIDCNEDASAFSSSIANGGLEAQSHQALFLVISGPDIGGKSARSPQGALSHSLKTIHKVRTVPYPSEKLIECLVGLV
jgi:hypothetical protein